MGISNVMEGVIQNGTKRTVHCTQCTTKPIPLFASEVRYKHVGMLEISYQNQMVIGNHKWQQVKESNIAETECIDTLNDHSQRHKEGYVSLHDQPVIFWFKKISSWRKMVCIFASVLGRSSCIEH